MKSILFSPFVTFICKFSHYYFYVKNNVWFAEISTYLGRELGRSSDRGNREEKQWSGENEVEKN